MMTYICAYLKNWFVLHKYIGKFKIDEYGVLRHEHGETCDDILKPGQWFRVIGTALSDGVYQYRNEGLAPEEFEGAVWAMAVPPALVSLAQEIETWTQKNADALNSPYTSESFGGYSYSKGGSASGGAYNWQDQFAARLAPWRKI